MTTKDQDTNDNTSVTLDEALSANEEFNKENQSLQAKLAEVEAELKQAKTEAKTAKAAATRAKNNAGTKRVMESGDFDVGQDHVRGLDDDFSIIPPKPMDEAYLMNKAANLAFMEEPVLVEISDVSEQDADHGFPIFVNGQCEMFFRGTRKVVKRKFVEGLARARKTGYKCKEVIDPDTGERQYVYPSHTGLRFPFSVIEDRNPDGKAWLSSIFRQG